MNYQIEQLKDIIKKLEFFLEENNINDIPINNDYYWNIESTEKFELLISDDYTSEINALQEPSMKNKILNIGSLYDDIQMLDKVIDGSHTFSSIDIDRVAHILEYIMYYISVKV